MRPPAVPNFFLLGTGKAGTTSLFHYLKQHPQIFMSPVKEPAYFAPEIRAENLTAPIERRLRKQSRPLAEVLNDGQPVKPHGWLAAEWTDYQRLFQGVTDEKAIGEASAIYLWSEKAAYHIRVRIPHARLIMILRDPAERAFSQYLHQLAAGLTRSTFRQHLEQCERIGASPKLSIWYPFLEIGLYSAQVQRYLDLFPRSQIRIYWYEEAWREPMGLLKDLFEFLDVDPTFQPDISRKSLARRAPRFAAMNYLLKTLHAWYPLKALVPQRVRPYASRFLFRRKSLSLDPGDRRWLVDYYRDDIRKLSLLLERDLSAWLR